jgi:hypothetical protein
MTDKPRHRLLRRSSIQVEPLEGRALLSALEPVTPPSQMRLVASPSGPALLSPVTAPTSAARTQLVISPSSQVVNQQQGSFTVTLYLMRAFKPRAPATLDHPLTVDFSASTTVDGSVDSETGSPIFAPFHESVTFPAGASAETVTVPIRSSATATVPTAIYLEAVPTAGSNGDRNLTGFVNLYSGPDASPPTITGVRLVTQGKLASAVVLNFSKPMAQATVEDIQNYRVLSRPSSTSHGGFLFWGASTTTEIRSFPIAAANYDSSTSTVTLTLKRPVRASSLYEVSSAYPLKGHNLTDTQGQPISSPGFYSVMEDGFINLIHPIPGFTPSPVGPLKSISKSDSPVSSFFNPMKGFA